MSCSSALCERSARCTENQMSDKENRQGEDPSSEPEAPPTQEEVQAAQELRQQLSGEREGADRGWLLAHLRVPSGDDLLGDLRARGLVRSARDTVLSRQAAEAARKASVQPWRRLWRSLR